MITSGSNGYAARAGYNLVTGLGTPVANLLVPDLVGYQGPGTTYAGLKVGPSQNASLEGTGARAGGAANVVNVFDSLTATGSGFGVGGHLVQAPTSFSPPIRFRHRR